MTRRIAVLAALPLISTTFSDPVQTALAGVQHPPAVQQVPVNKRSALTPPHVSMPTTPRTPATDTAWPSAGAATADLSGDRGSGVRAGGLPVVLRPAAGAAGAHTAAGTQVSSNTAQPVSVSVLSHAQAAAAGVTGVLFTVVAGSGNTPGRVQVGMDYSSFRNAVGGNWADRLRLVRLPACALTTPQLPACRVQTPLASTDNTASSTVSAQVSLPSAAPAAGRASSGAAAGSSDKAARPAMVMAAVSGASGSNGDFTASSLSPSGTWSAGGPSGDFTWSYPLSVPKPAAGSAPPVDLTYNSADVDGRVATTNNQFGQVGEGWTLSNSYVARSYVDCADDPEGAIANDYDNCWPGQQVVTISLDGRSTPLVLDSSGKWHEQQDSGDSVQYLTGTASDTGNGTYDNGYWLVTTPDGTRYYFGKNRGPGWASGDAQTNSAWTEPVYGAHAGDPCNNSAGFAQSSCSMAWQWNLDFVIDPHGDAAIYTYGVETNYYGADNQTTGVQYDRAGYPVSIQYGIRDESGSVYAGTAPQQVTFTTAQRCIPTKTFTCDPAQFTAANAADWPDTPQDQQCLSGASCNNHVPSFWSMLRVTGISTQYYNGTPYATVDNYALAQEFSTQGDDELLLDSITRTGYAGSTSLALPPVNFTYQLMNNRVPGYNSQPSMAHWRLTNLQTETGEKVSVTYNQTCATSDIPSDASTNAGLCYPVSWTPPGKTDPILDYFNKYVAAQVEVQDTSGDPAQFTNYSYVGGAAWHYDDNQLVKAKNRTYGQFRGYGEVDTLFGDTKNITNGVADVQSETKTFYYRGMNGDVLPGGKSRSARVSDTFGNSYTDDNAFADMQLESQKLVGVGGAEVSASVANLTVAATTGSETVSGLPTLYATMVRPAKQQDFTDLAAGGTEVKKTVISYDAQGRPVLADATGTAVAESCTQTSYAANSAGTIFDAIDEKITAAQSCPATPGNLTAANILTDTRTYFDGSSTLGQITGPANATMSSEAVTNTAGTLSFTTQSTTTYDAMGRPLTVKNARGNTTTTAYTPTDGGPLTQVQTTDALSHKATTTYDPGRGSVLSETAVDGYVTSATYDPLGHTTAIWKPGRTQGQVPASVTYAYQISQTAPLAVTTQTLVDTGTSTNYITSIAIDDALGQPRQTQTQAEGGNTSVTDTSYDSHGWVWQTSNNYVISGAPSTAIATVTASAANDRTVTTFDAAGRAALAQAYKGTTLTSSTQSIYSGNSVTTLSHDPSGAVIGSPSTTVSDVNGKTIETDQYSAAPSVNGNVVTPSVPGSRLATTTGYDAIGRTAQVQTPAGAAWSYKYDMFGRVTQTTDPDAGITNTTYDADGNVASTTDANGTKNNYVYDVLDRKTAAYTGSTTQGSGTEIGVWVYDRLKAGRLAYEESISPTTGAIYETGISAYDSAGNVGGRWVVVPASVTGLAGTYRTSSVYSTSGLLLSVNPAGGANLPGDVQTFTYDQYGNPVKDTGNDTYVASAAYTPFGQVSQLGLGSGPSAAILAYSYDAQTRAETGITLTDTQPSPQVDATTYTYNAAQQLTALTDTQGASGSAPVENQCFTYDLLNRLTAAWSATDQCAANPFTGGSNATVGGPEPYAQSWTFNNDGQRTGETDLPPAGVTTGTVSTTYNYGVTGHAHALASTSSTNSVSGPAGSANYTYDSDGNTKTRGSSAETLVWDPNGKLSSDTNSHGATGFIYDADGNQLIETDPGSSTLFLPGEQLTYNTVTKTLSGVQYYSFGGQTIAESTGTALYWLEGNTQGTMSVALNAFTQGSVLRRVLTPYGAPAANSTTWVDNRGLLGDPQQPATGLENIGARKYDPALGAFISVDPILESADTSQINGYAYGGDNPLGNADPTGLCPLHLCGFVAGVGHFFTSSWDGITAPIRNLFQGEIAAIPVTGPNGIPTSMQVTVPTVTSKYESWVDPHLSSTDQRIMHDTSNTLQVASAVTPFIGPVAGAAKVRFLSGLAEVDGAAAASAEPNVTPYTLYASSKRKEDLPTSGRPWDFGDGLTSETDLVPGYPAFPGGASTFDNMNDAAQYGLTNVKYWKLPEGTQLPDCLSMVCDAGINGNPPGHNSLVPMTPGMTVAEVRAQIQELPWQDAHQWVTKNRALRAE